MPTSVRKTDIFLEGIFGRHLRTEGGTPVYLSAAWRPDSGAGGGGGGGRDDIVAGGLCLELCVEMK